MPDLSLIKKNINYVSIGVKLGEEKQKRFEPDHFLFSAFGVDFKLILNEKFNSENTKKYLKGETIDVDDLVSNKTKGWQLVLVNGYPLGWGKLANGTLKNKYLPGWRWQSS